ncbi:MAG: T9SS type A sorting domain-containing protein [Ignavibacteria bacterium]|nr:T9SS type A sorting domain-containing protein [Ignavibacteria bacterium]
MKIKLIYLFFFFTSIIFSQVSVKEISHLNFDVILNSENYNIVEEEGNKIVKFEQAIPEYNTQYFILPKKDIFIALPSFSEAEISYSVKEQKKIIGKPEIAPDINWDSQRNITFSKGKLRRETLIEKKDIEIVGYVWIGNYYCAQVRINQYTFNNSNEISEKSKLNFKLSVKNKGKSIQSSKAEEVTELEKYLISNISNAVQLDRQLYDASLSKSDNYSWIDFNKSYLKIGTANDDIYRITKENLENFGISTLSIDPRTFKLYLKGNEVSIYVSGENDGVFDENDYLEFIGTRNPGNPDYRNISTGDEEYKEYANRYSDTTIYWLTWDGTNGKRIKINSGGFPITNDTLRTYREVAHYEQDRWLDYSISDLVKRQLPFWHANQTWVWGQQAVGTANRNFTVTNLVPGDSAKAFYKVQDFASNITSKAHKIGLSINSDAQVFDSTAFNKYEQKVVKAKFSSDLLKNGVNNLKTISFATTATVNSIEYDWYEVEYPRYLVPINDSLKFSLQNINNGNIYALKVGSFTNPDIRIYKFNGNDAEIYLNPVNNANNYSISDTINNSDKFIFKSEAKISSPKFYYYRPFQNLSDNSNSGEYILLTHKTFLNKASEYAGFIEENYNINSAVIDVERIYDQYNYGFFAPEPIKDFLMDVYSKWTVKPVYLNLVGDATYDYKANKYKYFASPKVENFVPSFGEPVSDSWYAIWNPEQAYVPQLFVGRIPVNSIEEFDHYFNKHRNYLNLGYDEWNKTYMFISSGDQKNPSELNQLKSANDAVINNHILPSPIGGNVSHLYKTTTPPSNFGPYTNAQVDSMISLSGLFISYLGHSGTQIWDNGITDVSQLHNANGKNPIITDFGCSTGKFAEPDIKAFSELFICNTNGEAIGYLGNASLGFFSSATSGPNVFYGILLKNDISIAKAHVMAKASLLQSFGSSETFRVFSYTNTFFGDPIIALKKPPLSDLILNSSDLISESPIISDKQDSTGFSINLFNLGVYNDTAKITVRVNHTYNGQNIPEDDIVISMPAYKENIHFYVNIKEMTGNHNIIISADPDNMINEINEDNNSIAYNFNVVNSSLRTIIKDIVLNSFYQNLRILNPSVKQGTDSIAVEISDNIQFVNPSKKILAIDTVLTNINFDNLQDGKRYFIRSKIAQDDKDYGSVYSFIYSSQHLDSYLIKDSLSFSGLNKKDIEFKNNKLTISTGTKEFSINAAGYYDGNYAVIALNGDNILSEGHLDGFHIAIIDSVSLDIEATERINYWDNTSGFAAELLGYLQSIPKGKYLLICSSGGSGSGITAEIRNEIKSFGSTLIDSVGNRHSWALIGYRGAVPGSVPEAWSPPYGGSVSIDTTFIKNLSNGFFVTKEIGASSEWQNLAVNYSIPGDASINILPIGIKNDNQVDSLTSINLTTNNIDISSVNAKIYPKLKLKFSLNNSTSGLSPEISAIGVNYKMLPELFTNYQVLKVASDTISQGGNNNILFGVYNIGENIADSFKVVVEIVKPDNSVRTILDTLLFSLVPNAHINFNIPVKLDFDEQFGQMFFRIIIDSENKVAEIYEDNNIYNAPFYVKKDTTVGVSDTSISVTFDGQEIMDGQYISENPKIIIFLKDLAEWYDYNVTKNNLRVVIDNEIVPASEIEQAPGVKEITYTINPKFNDGTHTFRVWVDRNSTFENASDIERTFLVDNTPRILDTYNYPNPFSNKTYFTFKLTQIPDELKIKIYTVAGRLIKEFVKTSADLRRDFNEIEWDGKDEDGDEIANGVYIYKVISKKGDKSESVTQKLSIVR